MGGRYGGRIGAKEPRQRLSKQERLPVPVPAFREPFRMEDREKAGVGSG